MLGFSKMQLWENQILKAINYGQLKIIGTNKLATYLVTPKIQLNQGY